MAGFVKPGRTAETLMLLAGDFLAAAAPDAGANATDPYRTVACELVAMTAALTADPPDEAARIAQALNLARALADCPRPAPRTPKRLH